MYKARFSAVVIIAAIIGGLASLQVHSQKPEQHDGLTWQNSELNFNELSALYLRKDGVVMFSKDGIVGDTKAIPTNITCDPEVDKYSGWHHCKAAPIQTCVCTEGK